MPLEILLALVIGGIAGIAAILHLTGHSRPCALPDDQTVRQHWARHRPDDDIHAVHLAQGAALVETSHGLGLLHSFGADTVAHLVKGMTQAPNGLRVQSHDFAAPDVTLTLTETEAADWLALWSKCHT